MFLQWGRGVDCPISTSGGDWWTFTSKCGVDIKDSKPCSMSCKCQGRKDFVSPSPNKHQTNSEVALISNTKVIIRHQKIHMCKKYMSPADLIITLFKVQVQPILAVTNMISKHFIIHDQRCCSKSATCIQYNQFEWDQEFP